MNIIKKSYFDVDCTLVFDERYAHKDGTHNISVMLYHNGKYYHHKTGLKLKSWDDASPREQQTVYKMYDKIYDLVADLVDQQSFSFDELCARLEAPKANTLNDFMRERIKVYESKKQFSTASHFTCALNLYTKVCGETPFAAVNSRVMNKLMAYMKEEVNGKQRYSNATICIYFSDLKSCINEAAYKGLVKDANYPFKKNHYDTSKIEIPKSEARTLSFLTKDEMNKVFDYYKETKNEYIGLFLFSYLAGGMNLADVFKLKWSQHYFDTNQRELIYKRSKTAKKNDFFIRVAISDTMREIISSSNPQLNDYVFHYTAGIKDEREARMRGKTICNLVTYHLKVMSEKLGFNKIVTPTFARHSYATILRRECVPGDYVEYTMGHSMNGSAGNYFAGYTTEQMLEFNKKLLAA